MTANHYRAQRGFVRWSRANVRGPRSTALRLPQYGSVPELQSGKGGGWGRAHVFREHPLAIAWRRRIQMPAAELRTAMVKALRVAFGLAILAAVPAPAEQITITPSGARSSIPGPARAYTGTAVAETLGSPNDSSHVMAVKVTFEPGARTAWHNHPAGQYLIVTAGVGWVQERGGEKREIRARRRGMDTSGGRALAWRDDDGRVDSLCCLGLRRGQRWRADGACQRRGLPRRLTARVGPYQSPYGVDHRSVHAMAFAWRRLRIETPPHR